MGDTTINIGRELIEALPRDALYVVPMDISFESLAAAVRTAAQCDRAGVTFVTPLFLDEEALGMLPKRRPIEVHPQARLEPEQQRVLNWWRGGPNGTVAA